jgi:hypothetical protein
MKTNKSILRTGIAASLLSLAAGYLALEGTAGAKPSLASLVPPWLWTVAWTPPHPPLPQIVNAGGATIATPRVVPLVYSSDRNYVALEDFAAKLGKSSYFTSVTAEYGVTSIEVLPPIVIDPLAPATVSDADVTAWLTTKLQDPTFPQNDGNTIYSFIYPRSTAVSYTTGSGTLVPLCGGYQFQGTAPDGSVVPFTLTGVCEDGSGLDGDLDYATKWTTSALLGAATNPGSLLGYPAWGDTDFAGSGWAYLFGAGINQMCPSSEGTARPADLGYLVPRVYSNKAAAHDHDPCLPQAGPPRPYFNAAPVADGNNNLVKGVSVPPGGEAVVPLALFSDRPMGSWQLSAKELTGSELTFELDESCGRSGDIRYLKIKRAPSTGTAAPASALGVSIVSTSGDTSYEWILNVSL